MSIASEITRLQGVKSDILQSIADKGVTIPAGSALADCPDLIELIPTGGGGGGDIAAIRCTKGTVYNRFEIPINTDTRSTFEIGFNASADWGNNSFGVFNGIGTTYYPAIQLTSNANKSNQFGIYVETNSTGGFGTKLYPDSFKFYHVKIYSTSENSFLLATDIDGNVKEGSKGSQFNLYTIDKIRLFNGNWVGNDTMAGIMIYYFRVTDVNNNVLLNLVPTEQNGVPGFLDNVSGNFYGPAVNDGTFEAVKPRAPLPI